MWVVEGAGGGGGRSAAGGGILILQQQAGRGQAEHDANNCPLCLGCAFITFPVMSNKLKLNTRGEREKKKIKLGTTDNQEGRLQHRNRPSCDDETPRTGEGLKLLSFNVGPYDSNVVEIPHKVTLSEVCVLGGAAAAPQHEVHAAVKLRT